MRAHSAALRKGVLRNSHHPRDSRKQPVSRERLAFHVDANVSRLIHRLLTPLTPRQSCSRTIVSFPRYAEAAPDAFLSLFETDLKQTSASRAWPAKASRKWPIQWLPAHGTLVGPGVSVLESPVSSLASVFLLARLSKTSIDDNWMNKPIHSP